MDFSTYQFRASQAYKLATGTIGITDLQKADLDDFLKRKRGFKHGLKDEKGKTYKDLTKNQKTTCIGLIQSMRAKEMPKTMQTELKKIYRAEKFKRNFVFTNKYIQKGLQEEDEAITVYQNYLKEVKGVKTLLLKNKERFFGTHFQGEPDIFDHINPKKRKEGFDNKNSWSLDTLPFEEDKLDDQYECQNQVYMHLTGLKKWTTVHTLVNASEDAIHKEKMKWYYALKRGNTFPDEPDSPYYGEYEIKCHEIERMMIFDYDRFVLLNPYHQLTISREEWFGEDYDIPLKDRVCEHISVYDREKIDFLIERVEIAREYLKKLK